MLRLNNAALARGARVLWSGATVLAPPGERIGLVGANGCGKSSLFSAILGELSLDGGTMEAPRPDRIAHVAQEVEADNATALDYVISGHAPLMAARAELRAAEDGGDEMALAHAHATLAEVNEGAIAANAHGVLHGLGFSSDDAKRPVTSFSGGWRNRLALARALLRPADLLLLDEPTNHLDLDSVVWLEAWLRRQPATVLVISHDREFLDRCVSVIWNIADGSLRRYAGNYSDFETAELEQRRQQDAAARQYERSAAHLTRFIERFGAQATKARQAQSRIKMLERLEKVEPVRAQHDWRFQFPSPQRLPERLLDGEALTLGYGPVRILSDVNFVVRAGDRIGILGVNGAGKTTLIRAIAADLQAQAGEIRRAPGLSVGYFAQHQVDQLYPEDSPLMHLRRLAPQTREQELRDFLGQFRFSGEQATAAVAPFSGGEKARLALALIAWKRPNLLVLDEPTNHLDMATREALVMALATYGGALMLVSHDRHLLRAAADSLWLVHDGRLAPFDGDLDDYAAMVLASRRVRVDAEDAAGAMSPVSSNTAAERRGQRRADAAERQRQAALRKPLVNRITQVEQEINKINAVLRDLDGRLADADFYHSADPAVVADTLKQRGDLARALDGHESRWLALQQNLEALGNAG